MVSFTARLTAAIMHAGILSGFTDEAGHSMKEGKRTYLQYRLSCADIV